MFAGKYLYKGIIIVMFLLSCVTVAHFVGHVTDDGSDVEYSRYGLELSYSFDAWAMLSLTVLLFFLLLKVLGAIKKIEAKLAQKHQALLESEAKCKQIIEHLPVGLAMHKDGVIQYLNPFFLDIICNETMDDVKGKHISDYLHAGDYEAAKHDAQKGIEEGVSVHGVPVRYHTPKGVRKEHEMLVNRTSVVVDGEPISITIALDVTEQNQIQRDLEKQHQMLEVILSSSPVGVWMRDKAGKLQFVNQAYANMLGVSEEALLSTSNDYALMPDEYARACKVSNEICRNDALTCRTSEFFTSKNGESIVCEVIKVPLLEDGEYQGLVGFSLNVTKRVEAEIEKSEVQKKALESQHLESLGVLTGGIAHDFNNLLAVILGNASLVKKRLPTDSSELAFVSRIEKTSQKAADLCKQMLVYAGKGSVSVKGVHLSDVVREMTSLLEVSLFKHVHVEYDLASDVQWIEGDIAQLQQLVMNLITNANESMKESGGVIRVKTYNTSVTSGLTGIVGSEHVRPGEYVCIEVDDEGCGMDEGTKQRIFEPFFTTKFTGRGLGMSAMLGTVQSHEAIIQLESELGEGTTFRVLFPVNEACGQSAAAQATQDLPETHAEVRGKILLVDDEEDVLEMLQAMLEDLGYESLIAEDGVVALEVYEAHHHEIETVILDMTMPRMSGMVCAEELLKKNKNLNIILASGYTEEDIAKQFRHIKLAGIVQKPFSFEQLQEALFNV